MFAVNTKFRMKPVVYNKELPWIIGSLKFDFKDNVITVVKVEGNVLTVQWKSGNRTLQDRVVIEAEYAEYYEVLN